MKPEYANKFSFPKTTSELEPHPGCHIDGRRPKSQHGGPDAAHSEHETNFLMAGLGLTLPRPFAIASYAPVRPDPPMPIGHAERGSRPLLNKRSQQIVAVNGSDPGVFQASVHQCKSAGLREDGNRASDNECPAYRNDLHKPRSSCQKKEEFVRFESAFRPFVGDVPPSANAAARIWLTPYHLPPPLASFST